MSSDPHYPDDIRKYDNDPRSPFYQEPPEIPEEQIEEEVQELCGEPDGVYDALIECENDEAKEIEFLQKCGEYIANRDWMALGVLIGERAYERLEEVAIETIEQRDPPEPDYDEEDVRRRHGR